MIFSGGRTAEVSSSDDISESNDEFDITSCTTPVCHIIAATIVLLATFMLSPPTLRKGDSPTWRTTHLSIAAAYERIAIKSERNVFSSSFFKFPFPCEESSKDVGKTAWGQ